jgi:hypothetical protein
MTDARSEPLTPAPDRTAVTQPRDGLHQLTTVRHLLTDQWLASAQEALLTFQQRESGGFFWRDTGAYRETQAAPSLASTSRAFMALVAFDRCAPLDPLRDQWGASLHGVLQAVQDQRDGEPPLEYANTFEVAHVADLFLTAQFLQRFNHPDWDADALKKYSPLVERISETLVAQLGDAVQAIRRETRGQLFFQAPLEESAHYFVTLHTLRALHILAGIDGEHRRVPPEEIDTVIEECRRFCVEQCFAVTSGLRGQHDILRLVFAGVAYCLYAPDPDPALVHAFVETLAKTQHPNGSWPATHPIMRGRQQGPWYITSHEVALCLTWLYFKPGVEEDCRRSLLDMMARYFRQWVLPTYTRVSVTNTAGATHVFAGWQDDHTVTRQVVVGWATAIVAHFTANYYLVLNDACNREAVRELSLAPITPLRRAQIPTPAVQPEIPSGPTLQPDGAATAWFDLPPLAWSPDRRDASDIAGYLRSRWTDGSADAGHSASLAKFVLAPVLDDPAARPARETRSGMLGGPPGTRKTTLVKRLGEVLGWPVVSVPASVLFSLGFDMLERRADEVFRVIGELTGCVILFDEFEELFRDRSIGDSQVTSKTKPAAGNAAATSLPSHPAGAGADRTIAAFTTSSMLPKLHDLHERGHCLIILATNDQHRIDPAVMRPGRFDYWLEVLHPSAERVLQYLRNDLENARFVAELHLSQAQFAEARAAVETWIQGLTNPQKKQIPFAVAEAAMRSARSVPPPWDQMKEALKWWANSSRSYRQPGNDVTPPLLSTVVLAPS